MRVTTLGAAMALAGGLAVSAPASPIDWPADGTPEPDLAFHCAAVMTALGEAYEFALSLSGTEGGALPFQAPDRLIGLAGGPDRLGDITDHAENWRDHSESLARTSVYPRLTQSGTPYLADEGAELQTAAARCMQRFEL